MSPKILFSKFVLELSPFLWVKLLPLSRLRLQLKIGELLLGTFVQSDCWPLKAVDHILAEQLCLEGRNTFHCACLHTCFDLHHNLLAKIHVFLCDMLHYTEHNLFSHWTITFESKFQFKTADFFEYLSLVRALINLGAKIACQIVKIHQASRVLNSLSELIDVIYQFVQFGFLRIVRMPE